MCVEPGCPRFTTSGRCDEHRLPSRGTGWETSRLKRIVLAQQGGRCAWCGTEQGPFDLDHVVPRHRGGGNERSNLQVLCRRPEGAGCHAEKTRSESY